MLRSRLFAFEESSSNPDVVVLGYSGATRHDAAGYTLNVAVAGSVVTSATVGSASAASPRCAPIVRAAQLGK